LVAAPPATEEATPAVRRPGTPTPVRLALGGVVSIAFVLNCWALSRNGLGNTYYSAASRSMVVSWRNFFFASFDPGGYITVDKPPVALWIEAMSVRMFGYSSWSLLLPSALGAPFHSNRGSRDL
jgi:4-amino-4-deoxy-L-arabinose transferase-like glycosyltransferase